MPEEQSEVSKGGSRIIRHTSLDQPYELPNPDYAAIEQIEGHIHKHLPGDGTVFHEILSDKVHIDVHIRHPTPERRFFTLVTAGMSDRPMTAPPNAQGKTHAELMLCLPETWPISEKAFQDESNYWPIRWLKTLALLPHQFHTWLWRTHTVPNGDPAKPFASNTKMCGVILAAPVRFGAEFIQIPISGDKTINILSVLPIYKDEMNLKLKEGAAVLFRRFTEEGVDELLDPGRQSVVKHRKLFGLFG